LTTWIQTTTDHANLIGGLQRQVGAVMIRQLNPPYINDEGCLKQAITIP
jgi:hypothetical protein